MRRWLFSIRKLQAGVRRHTLLTTYITLLVLIPLAALTSHAFAHGPAGLWSAVTQPESVKALSITMACAGVATLINAVMGTVIAFVLVRDRSWVARFLEAVVDVPFALPTVVAGVTLMTLYGPNSPLHVTLANAWTGITVALLFVTLPFTVRAVEPVLESLTGDAEAASRTLGASTLRTFSSITLPSLLPAILTGASLSFARAIGEFGSVVFISGNRPFYTEVASSYIFMLSQSQNFDGAAAVSIFLLVVALVILSGANLISKRLTERTS